MNSAEMELLVLAARQGNRRAFAKLYDYLTPALLRFGFRLSQDRELAQDAVQDAWLSMASAIRRLREPGAFRAWMYRRVRWKVIDSVRRTGRALPPVEMVQVDDSLQQLDDRRDMMRALNRLPPNERQIIQLFYLDELGVLEIAVVLGIPGGTVKSRLHRARGLLQQKWNVKGE